MNIKIRFCLALTAILFFSACSRSVIKQYVPFDEERIRLSLEYMESHYGMTPDTPSILPKVVVVHWTAIPGFEESYRAFVNTRLPESRTAIKNASMLNVSAHYLIDRQGKIFQLMPDTLFGRHVIGLNHCAIGIENVGGREKGLNNKQFRANKWLIDQLIDKHPIEYVIGHHEYQKFIGHPLWKEMDPDYLTQKSDPGDLFMNKMHRKLKKRGIKGSPE
ncbi:MAG: N-acetylmuramoyl-L-alanine amidase [Cyclobacteriaceae bacterium]|nr:N-acetylmuramoyl-L-alanine amidase [Cyclobacteriaceae bacterium]